MSENVPTQDSRAIHLIKDVLSTLHIQPDVASAINQVKVNVEQTKAYVQMGMMTEVQFNSNIDEIVDYLNTNSVYLGDENITPQIIAEVNKLKYLIQA